MLKSTGCMLSSLSDKLPKYVYQDFLYANYGDDIPTEIESEFGNLNWECKTLTITLEIFDRFTQNRLKERKGGELNPYDVPNDAERHETQRKLLENGPSKEPIIVCLKSDGYELIEGWHRTIQSMVKWPEGYEQIAWVGYEA